MKLSEFSKEVGTFYSNDEKVRKITSLEKLLNVVYSFFLKEYDMVDDVEFDAVHYKSHLPYADRKVELRAYIQKELSKVKKLIKEACAYRTLDGKKKFYNYFFNNEGGLHNANYSTEIAIHKYFFRMRGSELYHVFKRQDLFHIPKDVIRLIGKQRFNQEGVPCLYLGESLYCAWEEVRRKDFEQVNFAAFKNTRKLNVLDFTIKPKLQRKEDFILAYIALLVSGKVDDKDAYKFQYDVSNLFMDVLLSSVAKGGNVDGIKYMSSRRYDGIELKMADTSRMYGYVFPPKGTLKSQKTKGKMDEWLRNTFKLTEPRTSFMYDVNLIDFDRTKRAITSDYQNTLFYKIEENLKTEEFLYCDN